MGKKQVIPPGLSEEGLAFASTDIFRSPSGATQTKMAIKKSIKHCMCFPNIQKSLTHIISFALPQSYKALQFSLLRDSVNGAFKVHMNRQKFWSFKKKLLVT